MRILYFAWLRQKIGVAEEEVAPPAEVRDIAGLRDWLATRSPGHAAALADRSRIRIAVDQAFATAATPLNNPREIAIFPPVTGG
jgi:molybdopterin converting factor subunit 1